MSEIDLEKCRDIAWAQRHGGRFTVAGKRMEELCDEVERLQKENERLRDLVRYCRGDLHHEGLITDQEYAALLSDSEAVSRLEGYDATKQQAREEALEEVLGYVRHHQERTERSEGTHLSPTAAAMHVLTLLEMRLFGIVRVSELLPTT